jgi:DUF4097 and DUF4098 domain-containing protein YvlB
MPSLAGEQVEQSMALNSANSVSIENLRGNVTIIGDDGDTVSVEGELDDKAQGFVFEQSGTRIRIKVEMPHNMHNSWNEKGSDLTIKIPEHVRVSFKGVSSNVDIRQFTDSVEIQTVSGDIVAEDLQKQIELITVSGNIDSKNLAGKIRLSSVSGDIDDRSSSGRAQLKTVSGELRSNSTATEVNVNSVSGDIELHLAAVDELNVSTVSGEFESKLTLNDNGFIKMSSVSGDLKLDFKNDVQASFNLKTNAGGDIVNRLSSAKAKRAKYGPSAKLSFETGNGKGSVRASTVSGHIEVK